MIADAKTVGVVIASQLFRAVGAGIFRQRADFDPDTLAHGGGKFLKGFEGRRLDPDFVTHRSIFQPIQPPLGFGPGNRAPLLFRAAEGFEVLAVFDLATKAGEQGDILGGNQGGKRLPAALDYEAFLALRHLLQSLGEMSTEM